MRPTRKFLDFLCNSDCKWIFLSFHDIFILRFIRQGNLAYREAREVASEDLLKARRNIFYSMSLPEIQPICINQGAFLKSCAILCGLLGINNVELPQLNFYIARIGLDLNLPSESRLYSSQDVNLTRGCRLLISVFL